MDNKNVCGDINSPKLNNTPMKRLGLSRKRKSLVNYDCNKKFCHASPKSTVDCIKKTNITSESTEEIPLKIREDMVQKCTMETQDNNMELEALVEIWKEGCKQSLLHLRNLLNEKGLTDCSFTDVLKKLGIWEGVKQYFQDDADLEWLDEEDSEV